MRDIVRQKFGTSSYFTIGISFFIYPTISYDTGRLLRLGRFENWLGTAEFRNWRFCWNTWVLIFRPEITLYGIYSTSGLKISFLTGSELFKVRRHFRNKKWDFETALYQKIQMIKKSRLQNNERWQSISMEPSNYCLYYPNVLSPNWSRKFSSVI